VGYQRPHQRYGSLGFYAGRGRGRRYEQRGHGFGGRQPDFRAGYAEQHQNSVPHRESGANIHGNENVHGNVHGGTAHWAMDVEVLGKGAAPNNQGHPHPSASMTGGGGGSKAVDGSTPIPAHMLIEVVYNTSPRTTTRATH
jgi:hypothetical protein